MFQYFTKKHVCLFVFCFIVLYSIFPRGLTPDLPRTALYVSTPEHIAAGLRICLTVSRQYYLMINSDCLIRMFIKPNGSSFYIEIAIFVAFGLTGRTHQSLPVRSETFFSILLKIRRIRSLQNFQ